MCASVSGRWIGGELSLKPSRKRFWCLPPHPPPLSPALSPEWKRLVKRPDMNSFYAKMKLLMPAICYRQLAARREAATQRGMQHQLESCRHQWEKMPPRYWWIAFYKDIYGLSSMYWKEAPPFLWNTGSKTLVRSLTAIGKVQIYYPGSAVTIFFPFGSSQREQIKFCHSFANPITEC